MSEGTAEEIEMSRFKKCVFYDDCGGLATKKIIVMMAGTEEKWGGWTKELGRIGDKYKLLHKTPKKEKVNVCKFCYDEAVPEHFECIVDGVVRPAVEIRKL